MKRKDSIAKSGSKFLTKAVVAGASLMLAVTLIPTPGLGETGSIIPFIQVAEADTLTLTSGKCGENATWSFNKSTGTLTIKGSGEMTDYDCWNELSPFQDMTNIKKVVIQSGITGIGDYAFYGCSNLTSLELPSTLTTKIGRSAFAKTGFRKLKIPGTVQAIKSEAFAYNENLTEITFENGIKELSIECIFETGVQDLSIPKSVTKIDWEVTEWVYLNNINVDSGNSSYMSKNGVLYDKSGKELVLVPGNRTGTFRVPNGVTKVGERCFYGAQLSEIVLPDSVTEIGMSAFGAMYQLTAVNIPKNAKFITVKEIQDGSGSVLKNDEGMCFSYCYRLEKITVAPENKYYTSVDDVLYSKDKTRLLRYPAGKSASYYKVLDSVTEIGGGAFDQAENLETIALSNKLKSVGEMAFIGCHSLNSLVIPSKIDSLSRQMIDYCPSLKHLIFLSRNNITLGLDFFDRPEKLVLHTYPGTTVNGKSASSFVASNDDFSGYTPIYDADAAFVMRGETMNLTLPSNVSASKLKNLEYVVRDGSVLKVSSKGVVTPLCEGTTEVYACGSGATVRYSVSVGFTDLKKSDYYYDAVYWAVDEGITGGVKDFNGFYSKFDPQGTCTRGQMIAFLWRMAGCPKPKKTTTTFTDLDPNAYYYKAVLWGVENKIVGGYADNTFRPQANCSRSQAVTFLWRYYDSPKPKATTSKFTDVTDTKAYYYDAVLWASENGVTGGYADGSFRLNGECSRAQMVTFLYRSKDWDKK